MSSENKEIWKKIEDYDYIVSNFGRIKNLKNNNLLKPQDNQISDAVKYNGFEVIKNWLNKTL